MYPLGKYHIALNFWSHADINCKVGICRVIRFLIKDDLQIAVTWYLRCGFRKNKGQQENEKKRSKVCLRRPGTSFRKWSCLLLVTRRITPKTLGKADLNSLRKIIDLIHRYMYIHAKAFFIPRAAPNQGQTLYLEDKAHNCKSFRFF